MGGCACRRGIGAPRCTGVLLAVVGEPRLSRRVSTRTQDAIGRGARCSLCAGCRRTGGPRSRHRHFAYSSSVAARATGVLAVSRPGVRCAVRAGRRRQRKWRLLSRLLDRLERGEEPAAATPCRSRRARSARRYRLDRTGGPSDPCPAGIARVAKARRCRGILRHDRLQLVSWLRRDPSELIAIRDPSTHADGLPQSAGTAGAQDARCLVAHCCLLGPVG